MKIGFHSTIGYRYIMKRLFRTLVLGGLFLLITAEGWGQCTISLNVAGTDNQTVCVNSPITNITYSTTGATGATVTGLPDGVTGSWAENVVTISGSPNVTIGSPYSYTVILTGCIETAINLLLSYLVVIAAPRS